METTENYGAFRTIDANRAISPAKVKGIIASIKEVGYINSMPITVDLDMNIIDGQHRFEACKQLGLPILYSQLNERGNNSHVIMRNLNKAQTSWTQADYIKYWSNLGKYPYTELAKMIEDKRGTITTVIVHYLRQSGGAASGIKKGYEFTFHKEMGGKTLDLCNWIRKTSMKDYNKNLDRAIMAIYPKLNSSEVDKIKKDVMNIPIFGDTKSYLVYFENVINFRVRANNRKRLV